MDTKAFVDRHERTLASGASALTVWDTGLFAAYFTLLTGEQVKPEDVLPIITEYNRRQPKDPNAMTYEKLTRETETFWRRRP